ncbi:hypothetical protein GCM10010357_05310 [Streptomyces luteireticuli]|uniref:Uncharacterized protein n=1 Tax=Streptomyces luteireticuli TaxID=173858 RepID=A0ABN0Y9H2_9ACTN
MVLPQLFGSAYIETVVAVVRQLNFCKAAGQIQPHDKGSQNGHGQGNCHDSRGAEPGSS